MPKNDATFLVGKYTRVHKTITTTHKRPIKCSKGRGFYPFVFFVMVYSHVSLHPLEFKISHEQVFLMYCGVNYSTKYKMKLKKNQINPKIRNVK